uniref:phosphate acyltransferase n=1 Tax=Biomphalaria glabrata TaxID=6526 RepID=A0A2C9KTB0_BIOGL
MAIDAAKQGETDGIVSCGNTGALMVMSKAFIGTLKDIDRPAILAVMPTMKNDLAMLDLGANIMCDAEILSQFAIMGNAYSKVVMQIESPSVAILNVGSESTKGKPEIKQAAAILQNNKNINFVGYIEPDEMFYGNVDVIITDGFSGNISLKTAEGVSMLIKNIVKEEAASMPFYEKIGFSIAKTFFKRINQRVDRRNFNGGPLLGIDSVVVKSHGSADSIAF